MFYILIIEVLLYFNLELTDAHNLHISDIDLAIKSSFLYA